MGSLHFLTQVSDFYFVVIHSQLACHPGNIIKLRFTLYRHALCEQLCFLSQPLQRCPVLFEHGALFVEVCLRGAVLRTQAIRQALRLELFPDQAPGKIILLRCKTEVQFLVDLSEFAVDFTFSGCQRVLIVGTDPDALLGLGQVVFHLPNGLLQELLRLFDLVQDGMKVRLE